MILSLALLAAAAGLEPDDARTLHATTRNVAIVLYPGVEILDFAGPTEVFAAAGNQAFNVYTVSASTAPLRSQGVVTVTPEYTFDNCPAPDIIVIPGGGTWGLDTAPYVSFARRAHAEISMSVCTGAFFLGEAGLLDGRPATTWWGAIDGLRRQFPAVDVKENVRYVDSGDIVTTAGVSAGIDGALHVVDRLLGRPAAERTAKYMEYRWEPDRPAVPPTDAARKGLEAWHARDLAGAAEHYATYAKDHPDDAVALHRLGVALARTGRAGEAIPPLTTALDLGHTASRGELVYSFLAMKRPADALPHAEAAAAAPSPAGRDLYNLACTRALLGRTDQALDALERAFELQFATSHDRLMADEDLVSLRDQPRFKAIAQRLTN